MVTSHNYDHIYADGVTPYRSASSISSTINKFHHSLNRSNQLILSHTALVLTSCQNTEDLIALKMLMTWLSHRTTLIHYANWWTLFGSSSPMYLWFLSHPNRSPTSKSRNIPSQIGTTILSQSKTRRSKTTCVSDSLKTFNSSTNVGVASSQRLKVSAPRDTRCQSGMFTRWKLMLCKTRDGLKSRLTSSTSNLSQNLKKQRQLSTICFSIPIRTPWCQSDLKKQGSFLSRNFGSWTTSWKHLLTIEKVALNCLQYALSSTTIARRHTRLAKKTIVANSTFLMNSWWISMFKRNRKKRKPLSTCVRS